MRKPTAKIRSSANTVQYSREVAVVTRAVPEYGKVSASRKGQGSGRDRFRRVTRGASGQGAKPRMKHAA